jgi:hypothetical protein
MTFQNRYRAMSDKRLLQEWAFIVSHGGCVEDSGDEPRIIREEIDRRGLS